MEYVLLISLWIIWCIVHSLLISLKFTQYLQIKLSAYYRFYRLFYNVFAVITFTVLLFWSWQIKGEIVFSWQGYLQIVRWLLLIFSLYLFWAGAKSYDMGHFLGLRQIISNRSSKTLSSEDKISTSGIMGRTRHPWYLAGILFIWTISPKIYMSSFLVNIVFTLYLVIGAFIEEKKLVEQFGDAYRSYQKKVPMFIPSLKK